MYSAIKKGENECFIGAFQFLYYKKWGKYVPDKILKEIFFFNQDGVSLKAIKDQAKLAGATVKIFQAQKRDYNRKGWTMLLINEDDKAHYIVVKQNGNKFLCFDPSIGFKPFNLSQDFILIDIIFKKQIVWKETFNFKNPKKISLFYTIFNLLGALLALSTTFYFKFALQAIEAKNIAWLKNIIILFAILSFLNVAFIYIKNLLVSSWCWKRIKKLYKYYFDYLLKQNINIKNRFSIMQKHDALSQGAQFLQYCIVIKAELINSIMLAFSTTIVLYYEYKLLILPVISIFIISSLLASFFRSKIFYNEEKIRLSEIKVSNIFLQTINSIELASGFEKNAYYQKTTKALKQNIKSNLKSAKYNFWVELNYQILATFFSVFVSAYVLLWIIKNKISIANGLYLITIATIMYQNYLKIWLYIFNKEIELDAYNKWSDFVTNYTRKDKIYSYNGILTYKNKLQGLKGHFQIKGNNGVGKTTYLKIFCGLFDKANEKQIYLHKNSKVLGRPSEKNYKNLGIRHFNLPNKNISSGQNQVRNILLALEQDFDSLVLDEALCSVEINTRLKIYDYVRKEFKTKTILVVDHEIDLDLEVVDIMI